MLREIFFYFYEYIQTAQLLGEEQMALFLQITSKLQENIYVTFPLSTYTILKRFSKSQELFSKPQSISVEQL